MGSNEKITNLIKTQMKAEPFKNLLREKLEEIENLIYNNIDNDGNTCETSQRICVINALKELDAAINGIEDNDMKP